MERVTTSPDSPIVEEDLLRARLYRLLARLLSASPSSADLALAAAIGDEGSELGRAFALLAQLARKTDAASAQREFNSLFASEGGGEMLPYASYYMAGRLDAEPLAFLRVDMSRLGIPARPDAERSPDHIAFLAEMMAGLIEGAYGRPADLPTQKAFFDAHVGCWAKRFFKDLEQAKSSVLYVGVGRVGRVFMEIEEVAFSMS